MRPLRSEFLFHLDLQVNPQPLAVGEVPLGQRRITLITGGTFEGPRLRGRVVPGANAAWVVVRRDDVVQLEVRLTLQTDDGGWIYMTYPGIGHGSADVMHQVNTGHAARPEDYYFRILPLFETSAPAYAWLNKLVAVGTGERAASGPNYDVYAVL
jgi:hypothetical protein